MRDRMEADGSPTVHVIQVPSPSPSSKTQVTEDRSFRKAMLRASEITGGLSYFPKDSVELEAALNNLNETIDHVYSLTYSTAMNALDGREHALDIRLNKAFGRSRVIVRGSKGVLCSTAPIAEAKDTFGSD